MLDINKISNGISLKTGRLVYRDIGMDSLAVLGVDSVVSIDRDTPTYLVKQTTDSESVSQKWIKNGIELDNEGDITNNQIILPQSQWED